jgi:hypothetical protein
MTTFRIGRWCRQRRSCLLAVAGSFGMLLAGCGGQGPLRLQLQGTVTLDGQPLPDGAISFLPVSGENGVAAGGAIAAGRYLIKAGGGPTPGEYRVEILRMEPTGEKQPDSLGDGETDVLRNAIPARYNETSELRATVTAEGPNQFDFSLSTKPAAK